MHSYASVRKQEFEDNNINKSAPVRNFCFSFFHSHLLNDALFLQKKKKKIQSQLIIVLLLLRYRYWFKIHYLTFVLKTLLINLFSRSLISILKLLLLMPLLTTPHHCYYYYLLLLLLFRYFGCVCRHVWSHRLDFYMIIMYFSLLWLFFRDYTSRWILSHRRALKPMPSW